MTELDPLIVDGPAIAYKLKVPEGTIRRWASTGLIARHGRDARGRTLYDYDEVEALAQRVAARRAPANRYR